MIKFSLTILCMTIGTSFAWADGFFVWHNKDVDILEPQQKAFVVFDDGVEDLVLSVKFEGAPNEFGWIVPLPSVPEINKPHSGFFQTLSRISQNPYLGMSYSSGMLVHTFGMQAGLSVQTFKVGIYDVAILEDGALLEISNWLKENRFFLKENAKTILAEYIAQKWVFVAVKIRPEKENETVKSQLANGEIQPLAFTFRTDKPIFPLRISAISQHQSEVLIYTLAEGGIVPDNTSTVQWDTNIKHKAAWSVFANDRLWHSIRTRLGNRLEGCPLIKSRAIFQADQMQDIGFHPYVPGSMQESDGVRLRAEKATSLGLGSYPNGTDSLLDFLREAKIPEPQTLKQLIATHMESQISQGQDIRCAIWALAQICSRGEMTTNQQSEAANLVIHWGSQACSWTLLEALNSLETLDPKSAADLAMANFVQLPRDYQDFYARLLTFECAKTLVIHGGPRHISPLQKIINQYYDPRSWGSLWLFKQSKLKAPWLGPLALQVAAACGDPESYNELEAQLFKTAQTSDFLSNYEAGKLHFGSYTNNYPSALIPGMAIIGHSSRNDFVVSDIARFLPENNSLKKGLFRTVAHSQSDTMDVPNDFRAVLISRLDSLDQNDEQLLKDIWHDSLENPHYVELPLGRGPGKSKKDLVQYNVNALAACYSLGVQGRVKTLLEFWDQTSWERKPEKMELAVALAMTDRAAALDPLLEYVDVVWGRVAETSQIQLEMETEARKNTKRPRVVPMDILYREEFLNRFFMKYGLDEIKAMATNEKVPPHLRYYLIFHRYYKHHFDSEEMATALAKLRNEIQTPYMQKSIEQAMD